MEYKAIVKDFAQRTRHNLDLLRSLQAGDPSLELYEVTQLINSLLGLLVFPQQSYIDQIPRITLDELTKDGWPIPRVIGSYPQVKDLNQLVRYIRNAIAHFNVHFLTNEHSEIIGMQIWNEREMKIDGGKKQRKITWQAELSLGEIESITDKFIDLLIGEGKAG